MLITLNQVLEVLEIFKGESFQTEEFALYSNQPNEETAFIKAKEVLNVLGENAECRFIVRDNTNLNILRIQSEEREFTVSIGYFTDQGLSICDSSESGDLNE